MYDIIGRKSVNALTVVHEQNVLKIKKRPRLYTTAILSNNKVENKNFSLKIEYLPLTLPLSYVIRKVLTHFLELNFFASEIPKNKIPKDCLAFPPPDVGRISILALIKYTGLAQRGLAVIK